MVGGTEELEVGEEGGGEAAFGVEGDGALGDGLEGGEEGGEGGEEEVGEDGEGDCGGYCCLLLRVSSVGVIIIIISRGGFVAVGGIVANGIDRMSNGKRR